LLFVTACSAGTDDVTVNLAPDVISSIDGSLSVHALVLAERAPAAGENVEISVDYQDRNGTAHAITPVVGVTDDAGAFDATITGLTWDGTGTVKVAVLTGEAGSPPLEVDGAALEATATFAVLDRTPPVVTITPPANGELRRGADHTITVHVTDEIGVSQVFFESTGSNGNRDRSSVVASGSTDTTISFDVKVPDAAALGSTITLYALAADLSGNQAAATPITITVVQ
jgi:hypothetical protein